jgi:hypothetical protein
MAVISKGITLSYKSFEGVDFKALTNLQEIPELGGDAEAIEITTLADAAHVYTDGIKNYGDSLAFKFLYEPNQFEMLSGLGLSTISAVPSWKVALPDGASCEFTGSCSVKLDGVGVNAALTYTLNIKPNSEMVWTFPDAE